MTDSVISWCRQNNMYVILDLHAAPGGQGSDIKINDGDPLQPFLWQSEGQRLKTIALWKKLAQRYKDETVVGAYDLLNEPAWDFEYTSKDKDGFNETRNIPLRDMYMRLTKAIREIDKNHLIIVEGNWWANNPKGILPRWDNNMAYSFHNT